MTTTLLIPDTTADQTVKVDELLKAVKAILPDQIATALVLKVTIQDDAAAGALQKLFDAARIPYHLDGALTFTAPTVYSDPLILQMTVDRPVSTESPQVQGSGMGITEAALAEEGVKLVGSFLTPADRNAPCRLEPAAEKACPYCGAPITRKNGATCGLKECQRKLKVDQNRSRRQVKAASLAETALIAPGEGEKPPEPYPFGPDTGMA